jgi:hypothetical protein
VLSSRVLLKDSSLNIQQIQKGIIIHSFLSTVATSVLQTAPFCWAPYQQGGVLRKDVVDDVIEECSYPDIDGGVPHQWVDSGWRVSALWTTHQWSIAFEMLTLCLRFDGSANKACAPLDGFKSYKSYATSSTVQWSAS